MTAARPILFPTDFQQHSEAAFEFAVRFALANGSKVIVMHVCNMPDMSRSGADNRTHHEVLKQQLAEIDSPRVDLEHVFSVADPGPEICRVAREQDCRMIVMGAMTKCGADTVSFGTVHGFVEKNATVPLVTLRQPMDSAT